MKIVIAVAVGWPAASVLVAAALHRAKKAVGRR